MLNVSPEAGRGWRWILVPLAIYGISRVVSGLMLWQGSKSQVALSQSSEAYKVTIPAPADPGYLGVISNWDGQWYRSIAENGYPIPVPTEDGEVVQNEWAFSPAYPALVRAMMVLFRSDFPITAGIVSLTCSTLAVILLYRLLLQHGDRFVAVTGVLGVSFFPATGILQVAYAESLALLLIVAALLALGRRRYGWVLLFGIGLSLTRSITLPLAVVFCLHFWWRHRRSGEDSFPRGERLRLAAVAITTAASGLLWPLASALISGNSEVFVASKAAWPSNQGDLGLLGSWLAIAITYPGPVSLFVGVLVLIVAYAVLRPGSRAWGFDLRMWSWVYPLYMLAVTRPNAGIIRYLVLSIGPLWPLPDAIPAQETRVQVALRWTMPLLFAAAGIIGQYYWATRVFTIDEAPSTQPFP